MTSQKQVATRLSAKNKSKIWSRAMVDECSFCAEWHSTAIVWDDVILAHTDCKEMDLCPIRAFFRRKAFPFWQICPKVKINLLCLLDEKVAHSPCGSAILEKNRSDRARRVVHSSSCTIQSRKCFHFLVTGYLLCVRWRHRTSGYRRFSSG